MNKKVILAYSGGLDTSCAIKYLQEIYHLDVIALLIDVGQGEGLSENAQKAKGIGAVKTYVHDGKQEFVRDFVLPTLKARARYQDRYLLATALSRPLISKILVDTAKKEKAEYVAHGSTGKGNDQVRFEVSVRALAKDINIIAPLREWELTTRESEIEYAQKHNIPIPVTKENPYSIDKNLWGISIECAELEDPWTEPNPLAYQLTAQPDNTPDEAGYVEISFEQGIPCMLDGKKLSALNIIERLNSIGAKHSIGRTDLVEDRLVGIKSREVYEAPAATILYSALDGLESITSDKEISDFRRIVSLKYGSLCYNGLWFTPLKKALDAFVDEYSKRLTGTVRMKLFKGSCSCVGRKSEFSLYKKGLATYEEGDLFDRSLADGFIKLWGLPYHKN